jgi:hypothetical protein
MQLLLPLAVWDHYFARQTSQRNMGKTNVVAFVFICWLPTRCGANAPPDDGQSDLVC